MKKQTLFISSLLIILFLNGCSKKDNGNSITAASLSFTANGINYSLSSLNATLSLTKMFPVGAGLPYNAYNLVALQQGKFVIALVIQTNNTLTQTSYTTTRTNYPSAELTVFNDQNHNEYAHRNSGDYMTVTITSLTNGLASGTFTAQMSLNNSNTILITNGKFDNIIIN
ncbi:MAG: hypothetical protein JST29_03790 [Bacteroidetes bacterium]|nr:hypothetical protein [Bacteroidota bacterium]